MEWIETVHHEVWARTAPNHCDETYLMDVGRSSLSSSSSRSILSSTLSSSKATKQKGLLNKANLLAKGSFLLTICWLALSQVTYF